MQAYAAERVPTLPALTTVADWETFAAKTRAEALRQVVFRGEAAVWRDAKTKVEWLDKVETGGGYTLQKLRYEALPGLWIPALIYKPEKIEGKLPVVLNVNGHDGVGKAADYKQIRCINEAKRGMIALNIEWYGMGQFAGRDYAHDQINHLDLCGTSGVGAFYLAMTRGIDLLLALPEADPTRVAVTGLSGGGWQTIFVSAFDTRVTLSVPVAGYSSFRTRAEFFSDLGDSEQTPNDLGAVTDYAVMTAMMAPRALLLTFNAKDDCCFRADHALPPLLATATPVYKLYEKESRLRSHVNENPGTHNYQRDNREALYKMIGDQFFPELAKYPVEEISSESEVKTREQLNVPLPTDNHTLHGLALALAKPLPRDVALPNEPNAARLWKVGKRERLRQIVHVKKRAARVVSSTVESRGGFSTTQLRFQVGDWAVPAVLLVKPNAEPKETVLIVADKGRADAAVAARARTLIDDGRQVLAVDPFYIGEAKVAERDYLFALLLATLGDRPLGVQASQVGAVARWARELFGVPVRVEAIGPRASVIVLTTAALEDATIAAVDVSETYGSLKELIERDVPYTQSPELFCFGLLEQCDVATLAALIAPRKVEIHAPSDRAKAEFAGLKTWYNTLGVDHDPLN